MDLNKHYARHQLLLIRATRATSDHCADAINGSAALLAERIALHQHGLGAAAAQGWDAIGAAA